MDTIFVIISDVALEVVTVRSLTLTRKSRSCSLSQSQPNCVQLWQDRWVNSVGLKHIFSVRHKKKTLMLSSISPMKSIALFICNL